MHFENRAALVLDLVFSGEMFGKAGQEVGKEFARKEVRKIMSSWRLCKKRIPRIKDALIYKALRRYKIQKTWTIMREALLPPNLLFGEKEISC